MATIDESNNSISELLNATIGSLIERSQIGSSTDSPSLETNLADPIASPSLGNNARKASEKLESLTSCDTEEKKTGKPEHESEEIKPFPKMKQSVKYSVEQLLALSKSPLVKCPNTFPDITTWIGDSYYELSYRERESEIERKKPFNVNGDDKKADKHNEENFSRSGEKSIILGPPKMSFASSQKQTMANAKSSERAASGRNSKNNYNLPRHLVNGRNGRNEDSRSDQNGKRSSNTNVERERNYSKERENGNNRKGTREDFEKSSSRENQGGRNRNNQGSGQNRKAGGKDGNIADRNRHFQQLLEKKLDISGDRHRYTGKQDTPEWMNYDPETEKNEKQSSSSYSTADETGYVDEIQAWKNRLNEQNNKKPSSNPDPTRNGAQYQHSSNLKATDSNPNLAQQNPTSTTTNTMFEDGSSKKEPVQGNIDYLFGPGGLSFKDEQKNMKPFMLNHDAPEIRTNSAQEPAPVNNERDAAQGSSRFFRLFQKDNYVENSSSESGKSQDSAMLNRILMGNQTGQIQNNMAPTSVLTSSAQTNRRMLSEADVLKTLGVTNTNSKQSPQAPRTQPMNSSSHIPGRMLTEEDIFKQLGATAPQNQQQSQFRSNVGKRSESNMPSDIPRMASEADILKTLGVNTHSKKTIPQDNLEDKTGFNMIMARLNKAGNDSSDTSESKPTLPELPKPKHPSGSGSFDDPSVVTTKKPEPSTLGNNSAPVASSKSIAALFGGNIPTSVYRQLSGKNEPGSGPYSPVQKSTSLNSPYVSISPNPANQFQPPVARTHYSTPGMVGSGNNLQSMSASSPMAPLQQPPSSGVPFEESSNLPRLSSPNNNMNLNQTPLYRSEHLTPYNLGGPQRPPVFFDQLMNNGPQQHPMLQQHHSNLRQQSPHDQFLPHLQQNSYMIPPVSSPYSPRDQFGIPGREPTLANNMGGFPMRPPPYMGGQPPHSYDSARRSVQNSMSGRMMTVEEIERLSMR